VIIFHPLNKSNLILHGKIVSFSIKE